MFAAKRADRGPQAFEAKRKWDGLPLQIGLHILHHGNVVGLFQCYAPDTLLFTFPVKHEWHQKADLDLIRRSAEQLVVEVSKLTKRGPVVLPRPGCGNGHLSWDTVRPVLEPILDDRFHVITF